MLTRKNLELDVKTASALGINVYRQTGSKRRPISLYFSKKNILKEISDIRDGLRSGNDDVMYDFCDSCTFKKGALIKGLDLKRNSNYICPLKICKEFQKKPKTKEAFIQRLDILHTYLATTT